MKHDELFDIDPERKNTITGTEKLILSVDTGEKNRGTERYLMKFFDNPQDLMSYVNNMMNGDNKVLKIFSLDYLGKTVEKTIKFANGRLDLIDAKKPE